jgi:hypothetical protein
MKSNDSPRVAGFLFLNIALVWLAAMIVVGSIVAWTEVPTHDTPTISIPNAQQ